MRPIYITRSLSVAADPNGIAESQTPLAGGALVLDGVFVDANGVAQLGPQRQVLFTFAADETGRTFVVTGTTDQGQVQSESVLGAAATAVTVLSYSTITSITIDAASAGAIEVGTNGVGASVPIPMDQYVPDFSATLAAILRSGAQNYTVQFTMDNVFDAYNTDPAQIPFLTGYSAGRPDLIVWWDHSTMTAQAASSKGVLTEPVKAVRLLTNSGTGEVELQVVQQGTQ
jgi:hypothetical protein